MSCVQIDNDERVCTLSDSLILQTFSNSTLMRYNFSISEGCEHKLVTTCDDEDDLDLEIRVDSLRDDFSSAKVAILYNEKTIIINENLSLFPALSPFNEIDYQSGTGMVSVSIPEITLAVTRNLTSLMVSFNDSSYLTAGLCGDLNGTLLFPDCSSIVDIGKLEPFKQSYKVNPSDQILRGERRECGEYH